MFRVYVGLGVQLGLEFVLLGFGCWVLMNFSLALHHELALCCLGGRV